MLIKQISATIRRTGNDVTVYRTELRLARLQLIRFYLFNDCCIVIIIHNNTIKLKDIIIINNKLYDN